MIFSIEQMHQVLHEFHLILAEQDPSQNLDLRPEAASKCQAVMVLSSPYVFEKGVRREETPEDRARVRQAILILKTLAAYGNPRPMLILNGEPLQLHAMKKFALELCKSIGFTPAKMVELNCGDTGQGNTMTQFQAFSQSPYGAIKNAIVITSGWQVPRVRRTAKKWSPGTVFQTLGVPFRSFGYDYWRIIEEITKIPTYSQQDNL
ncbi:MAG: hypothetical protein WCT08_04080 [Patescibacteria group bacterium]|jgi:hypothetical protein